MTLEELKEKAVDVFTAYPTADTVYACEDGNLFLHKNDADLHASEREIKVLLEKKVIHVIARNEGTTTVVDEPIEGESECPTEGDEIITPPEETEAI